MARCRKLDPQLPPFQSWRHGQSDFRLQLQLANFRPNRVFGLDQSGISEPTNLFFNPFEPIGPAQTWIAGAVVDRFARQDRVNAPVVAKGNFFEPVHEIAQVVFADLECDREPRQGGRVIRFPVKPALQRLRMKTLRRRVIANFSL